LAEPRQPLVREPDRVDHPRRRLEDPRWRIAGARLGRDRLRDERREGEVVEDRLAEGTARGDRVEGPAAVDHGMLEMEAGDVDADVRQCPDPATRADSISAALTTGPST